MTCSGCQLEWRFQGKANGYSTGTLYHGSLSGIGGTVALTPTFVLTTFGGQPWMSIQGVMMPEGSGNPNHGHCGPSGQQSGAPCIEVTPCSGIRSLNYTVYAPYTMDVVAYNITNGDPFHCGETDYITVRALSGSGMVVVSPNNTLSIKCGDC